MGSERAIRTTIVFVLLSSFLLSCDDKKTDTGTLVEKEERIDSVKQFLKNDVAHKIDLLCLKYDSCSEKFNREITDYILDHDFIVKTMKGVDDPSAPQDHSKLLYGKVDMARLKSISEKNNVPLKTLASLIYDYEIWSEAENHGE